MAGGDADYFDRIVSEASLRSYLADELGEADRSDASSTMRSK